MLWAPLAPCHCPRTLFSWTEWCEHFQVPLGQSLACFGRTKCRSCCAKLSRPFSALGNQPGEGETARYNWAWLGKLRHAEQRAPALPNATSHCATTRAGAGSHGSAWLGLRESWNHRPLPLEKLPETVESSHSSRAATLSHVTKCYTHICPHTVSVGRFT